VISANDLFEASHATLDDCDVFIASAAVADFRPDTVASQKMKKKTDSDAMTIHMVKNPDIVASIASANTADKAKPFVVGFAAETQQVLEYAKNKLQRKNLDMIIANDVSDTTIGFNSDDNAITIITKDNQTETLKASKRQLAAHIVAQIAKAKSVDNNG